MVLIIGAYAALVRRRFELFLVAPLYPVLLLINSVIFIEQFINEVILRKHMIIWFKPERSLLVENK